MTNRLRHSVGWGSARAHRRQSTLLSSKDISFGFSICRTPRHPFPWVSAITGGGAAEEAGLLAGDCLLSVQCTPLVGLPVQHVARTLREAASPGCSRTVKLFFWRPSEGCCEEGTACPFDPRSLELALAVNIQRLLLTVNEILAAITCPVCLEKPIPNPAIQCTNGHLLCLQCRRRSSRCPVCRIPLRTQSGAPLGGRCLLADQIQAILVSFGAECAVDERKEARGEAAGRAEAASGVSAGDRVGRGVAAGDGREASSSVVTVSTEGGEDAGVIKSRRSASKHRGAKALIRGFVSWLATASSRHVRQSSRSEQSLTEGDIYRLCAAM